MKRRTDKQRMDFIEAQRFTRWAGFSYENGNTIWPVFPGQSFREAIDRAMDRAIKPAERAAE